MKGNAALTMKVTAQSYHFTHHTILLSASKHSVKVKKSLDGGCVTTAGKKNQSSHFKCICLLIYLSRKTGRENDVLILIQHDYIGIIRTLIKGHFTNE